MPTYRPYNKARNGGPCPTPAAKPWMARAKRDGRDTILGHFTTYAEACAEEDAFAEWHPPRVRKPRMEREESEERHAQASP